MSGKNGPQAIVVAYLMKSKGWRLGHSYQWVKERRPSVEISQALYQQQYNFEQKIFGNTENSDPTLPVSSSSEVAPAFSFGFEKPNDGEAVQTDKAHATSGFATLNIYITDVTYLNDLSDEDLEALHTLQSGFQKCVASNGLGLKAVSGKDYCEVTIKFPADTIPK
ncbi:hypothetical protein POM88_032148 [Heracleum sosnowskyi]|uniref:Uncharacterized protein n=1 Tax=Heracleum sosnowskyi TaxID=360622 RepID=A0AAD8I1N4_9APIA|nr:hypothetical protein POM88_032148 [Heracleum sosnowskyi]